MASTTKTTNLELSQFVGTDKPAWLTDYNGDMQKIDVGYKKLEDANTATQTDLNATKQDLSGSKTDIDNVKASVQALEAQDIAIGNRIVVLEGNYDTIHHEVINNTNGITTINNKLNGQEATGIIKYNMGITDKIKSIEIRTTGGNNEALSLYVTTASGAEKFIHLYDYDRNVVLPNFYSELSAKETRIENVTVAAGESKNFTIPIGTDIICATSVRCNSADVRCYNFFLENSQTADAKINFWIKNYGTDSWTGDVYYTCLQATKKGVPIE